MTELTKKQLEKLAEDFPAEALSKDTSRGFELTSIKAMYVIERLNEAFGVTGWRYKFTKPRLVAASDKKEYVTRVALQLVSDEKVFHHVSQYGGKHIVKDNHADALKSSITDGLTKCASILGIGHTIFKGQKNGKPPETTGNTKHEREFVTDPMRKKMEAWTANLFDVTKDTKQAIRSAVKLWLKAHAMIGLDPETKEPRMKFVLFDAAKKIFDDEFGYREKFSDWLKEKNKALFDTIKGEELRTPAEEDSDIPF